ncbi:hypothetical protein BRADI_2g26362v3 [Brachypodium distachyon]|uniref:Uncharacterized protein n=1 Tax=Brachypodium distachyon TaxID=15368 RepID=A0A2K2DAN2_BRADI|nr:hypothetical protein BRADI_2g26362v3 [Brachypodium distachyon]
MAKLPPSSPLSRAPSLPWLPAARPRAPRAPPPSHARPSSSSYRARQATSSPGPPRVLLLPTLATTPTCAPCCRSSASPCRSPPAP